MDERLDRDTNEELFELHDLVKNILDTKNSDEIDSKIEDSINEQDEGKGSTLFAFLGDENGAEPESDFAKTILGVFQKGLENDGLFRRSEREEDVQNP